MAHKKSVKKEEFPDKNCSTCGNPFSWRKKWAKNWAEMKYCSRKCAAQRNPVAARHK
ncbi:MAG: DUF2256 domain-containing protein [Rhizobiaceae bacterium]